MKQTGSEKYGGLEANTRMYIFSAGKTHASGAGDYCHGGMQAERNQIF